MAVSIGNSPGANGSGISTSTSTTFVWFRGSAPSIDNLLVLFIGQTGLSGTPAGVTLPANWVRAVGPVVSLDGTKSLEVWYKPKNGIANTASVLVQFDTAVRNLVWGIEGQGVIGTAPVSVTGSAQPATIDKGPKVVSTSGADNVSDLLFAAWVGFSAHAQSVSTDVAASFGTWADQFAVQAQTANATQMGLAAKAGGTGGTDRWAVDLNGDADTGAMIIIAFLADTSLINPAITGLAINGNAPTVQYTTSATPAAGTCAITGAAPVVRPSLPIPQATLALIGAAPGVSRSNVIAPSAGAVAFAGVASTLTQPTPTARNPAPGSLALTGSQSLTATTVSPVNGFMILAGLSPPLDTNTKTATGALAVSGQPAVFDRSVQPNAGQLAITGIAPVQVNGTVLTPTQGGISTGGATSQASFTIASQTGALAVTGIAGTVLANTIRQPLVGNARALGVAPVLINDIRITPFVGALAFTAPVALAIKGNVAAPNGAVLAVQGALAAPITRFFLAPATAPLSLAGTAQNIGRGIPPAAAALAMETQAPGVALSFVVTPNAAQPLAMTGGNSTFLFNNGFAPSPAQLSFIGAAAQLSFKITPGGNELVFIEQQRNISVAITPKTARLALSAKAVLIGKDVRVFGLVLTER